ncbi:hypothetical protein P7C73_g1959, partial [Tremellales sp. Uapishka_1]
MFKKRTRPTSVREKSKVEEVEEVNASGSGSEVDKDEDGGIEELIMLRKLRKSQPGIDILKLNRGEDKKKGKKKKGGDEEVEAGAADKFGLHGGKGKGDEEGDAELDENGEIAKRLVRTNNFTSQTNALDVDKHMLKYIEEELLKRRGGAVADAAARARRGEAPEQDEYDPQAELYQIAERYKLEHLRRKDDEEGNVTSSLGMLTGIPEVDLGMDNRLKNIEETEKAKREMMKQRDNPVEPKRDHDTDYTAARFFRPQHRVPSDVYIMEDAKREAAGLPPAAKPKYDGPRHENATDEQVYDRFKKRMKK